MTQSDLGERLGVSFQQIQKYERGSNAVAIEKLLLAASILRVDLTTFWQDANEVSEKRLAEPSDRGTVALVKTYRRITNPRIRQTLLELVRKIAEADEIINGE
jgi:transcriptional regulator with XRE-family HTH domain